jgi:hypothetical protein
MLQIQSGGFLVPLQSLNLFFSSWIRSGEARISMGCPTIKSDGAVWSMNKSGGVLHLNDQVVGSVIIPDPLDIC